MLAEEDQITHLLEQGEWLGRHKDGLYLMNYNNMLAQFKVSKEVHEHVKTVNEGEETDIRRIILEWKREAAKGYEKENCMVSAVERVDNEKVCIVYDNNDRDEIIIGMEGLLDNIEKTLTSDERKKICGDSKGSFRLYSPTGRQYKQTTISPYLTSLKRNHGGIRIGSNQSNQTNKPYQYRQRVNQPGQGNGGRGSSQRGRGRGRGHMTRMRNVGNACVVTTTKDPAIIGTYSDVLTANSSNDTTITQSTISTELASPWTRKEVEELIAAEVRRTTAALINPALEKVANTNKMVEETKEMMENTNQRVKKLEDFSNEWKELQTKETNNRKELNDELQKKIEESNNQMEKQYKANSKEWSEKIDRANQMMMMALQKMTEMANTHPTQTSSSENTQLSGTSQAKLHEQPVEDLACQLGSAMSMDEEVTHDVKRQKANSSKSDDDDSMTEDDLYDNAIYIPDDEEEVKLKLRGNDIYGENPPMQNATVAVKREKMAKALEQDEQRRNKQERQGRTRSPGSNKAISRNPYNLRKDRTSVNGTSTSKNNSDNLQNPNSRSSGGGAGKKL